MNDKTAFPLCWPDGWRRTINRTDSRFQRAVKFGQRWHSMEDASSLLAVELDRIGASNAVLSTNVRLRVDGKPYSGQAQPVDPGAAVFFRLKGRDVSLACDRWKRVECNVYAIAKHIEALRGQERWGVGSIEQAFRGYMALPLKASGISPHEVLGVAINATEEQIVAAGRTLSKKYHPDSGTEPDAERFIEMRKAHDLLMQNARKTV